jgi:hypothetical protein
MVRGIVMLTFPPLLSRRTRRLLAAWLGMLAVVAQALLPIVHPMAPSRALTTDAAALGKIVICTPYGFKLVSLDELPGEDTKRKAAPGQFCPLCLAVQSAAILPPPDGPALGCVAAETTVAFLDPATTSTPPPATGPPQARAPPFFA